ncbi:MAG: cysteine desulfurase [Alphaproteobacteria bacterium]|nr:cysteine desulfurase [Alphaproteobacteria bacterium]
MTVIYLDHNATTPVLPEVFEAMRPWFVERFANPSSSHPAGVEARAAIDRARAEVAALIGARPNEIVFTGSGTEASNLAIRGAFRGGRVVISAVEHPATREPALHLQRQGAPLTVLGVDGSGAIVVPDALPSDTAVLSVMHANNETGVLQPVRALADLAHAAGAVVHADAAQSLGKVPVDVGALGVDLLTIAGHKLYAPKGVGALYVRDGVALQPVIRGAGHERGLRPGTENVAGIVGLGAACARAGADLDALSARLEGQREALWARLRDGVPGVARNGAGAVLPNTLNVRFPGVSGNALLAACPDLAASTGSACHAHGESASAVLLAMGIPEPDALGAVRLSLGRSTTDADVAEAAAMLVEAWNRLHPEVSHRSR